MTLPAGVIVRTVDPDDAVQVEAAYTVASRCELEAVGWTETTRESMRASLTAPDAWTGHHRLAADEHGPVGLLVAELDLLGREVFLDAYALGPDSARLLLELLESGMADAAELARDQPAPPGPRPEDPYQLSQDVWQVVSASFAADRQYAGVLARLGFRAIRRFWRMLQDLTDVTATPPPAPAGVTRRVVEGESDRRSLHAVFSTSFADHFGSTHDQPYDQWIASVSALPGADPERWWIASLDGADVGLCIVDDSKAEFGEGYVRTLGVIPSARGRGIARWLLACAAADSVARGRSGLALAVDGENATGATELYESVGFSTRQVIDVWCYPLD
jgi:ribosomal protein S18 acetylase RimI-like enzyme